MPNVIEIALLHGFSPVNLLHIFRTPFSQNTTGWLLLQYIWTDYTKIQTDYWEKILLMSFLLITKLIPNGIDIQIRKDDIIKMGMP